MFVNLFRLLGDLSHLASKIILMWAIHWNRSTEGVSLITQVLYAAVFSTRYLDLFWVKPGVGMSNAIYLWNLCFKLFYIASSFYIIFLMTVSFARTREREKAWRFGIWCLGGAVLLSVPLTWICQQGPIVNANDPLTKHHLWVHEFTFTEILWTFSEVLESVCVLPQLVLLRQTTVPTVIDSYYLVCLGSYRAFYILNWIVRLANKEQRHFDPISVIFGILQTALYVDFAWVYYSRQRVKLRAGGIVDEEDLGRGWLVGRLVGKHADLDEEGALASNGLRIGGNAPAPARKHGRWGARGISVSADDDVQGDSTQPLTDPNAFEDDLSDDDPDAVPVSARLDEHSVGNGSEWDEEGPRGRG
ncbi:hypothetical protein EJ06DRAFT_503100 [Trichodelitschia bisporula]|uniref:ER lumen protein retaining receptor n=1 Tax=Trichodelitschia bisporula TaxID=703511 RepID=A0A6G1I7Y1_9PEZI|nr:hypothetical protein EJ06DRAFT_503100 [Trichodelitschia bisporula]